MYELNNENFYRSFNVQFDHEQLSIVQIKYIVYIQYIDKKLFHDKNLIMISKFI